MEKPKNPSLVRVGAVVLVVAIALVLLIFGPRLKRSGPDSRPVTVDKTLFLEIRDEEGNFLCTTPRCRGYYSEEQLPKIQEWMTAIAQTENEGQKKAFREMLSSNLVSSDRLLLSVRKRDPLANPGQDPQPGEGTQIDEFPYSPPPPETTL